MSSRIMLKKINQGDNALQLIMYPYTMQKMEGKKLPTSKKKIYGTKWQKSLPKVAFPR